VCIYCVSGEFVVLRDGYKVDIRWIHLAATNKPATINEEAICSHSYNLSSTTAIKLVVYSRRIHNLNLFLKLYRTSYTRHPTHISPAHAYGVFN